MILRVCRLGLAGMFCLPRLPGALQSAAGDQVVLYKS